MSWEGAYRQTGRCRGGAHIYRARYSAQVVLPQIDVNWTRLNSGMVGTSNSIITRRISRVRRRKTFRTSSPAKSACRSAPVQLDKRLT